MSKATEEQLSELHGVVAKTLKEQIEHRKEETTFTDDGLEVGTGEFVPTATPATIAAAIKFLKDNDITADMETDENLTGLRDALAKKQQRSRLSAAEAADNVHKLYGDD